MKLKPAYPRTAYRDKPTTAPDRLTHPKEDGINNFELFCLSIAPGVIRMSLPNATIKERATQVADQAEAIIDEIESRGLNK